MFFLINLFDNSVYIKPAVPSFITLIERRLLLSQKLQFKKTTLNPVLLGKINSAVKLLENYASYLDTNYENAQKETLFICGWDLLKEVSAGLIAAKNMFDASYSNVCRLLAAKELSNEELQNIPKNVAASRAKGALWNNKETSISKISGGVSIYNNGLLNSIKIVSKEDGVKISLAFRDGTWDENNISFIDVYIDVNNLFGVGSCNGIDKLKIYFNQDFAWEYCLRFYKQKAVLYRYINGKIISNDILSFENMSVLISKKYIKGNPQNWSFQAVSVFDNNGKNIVKDILNQEMKPKSEIISSEPIVLPPVKIRD
jgi:hypothetical protein